MGQNLDQELATYASFWQSGNYVLNHWRDNADDILHDCMIYDLNERVFVRIEDNTLYYALKTRMMNEGVPVVRELPPGKHILEQAIEELANIMTIDEFAIAYEELKQMLEAGSSRAEIKQRLHELKANAANKLTQES